MTKETISLNDITDIEVEGIDNKDHPQYCDAYISSATWRATGIDLTEEELESLDPGQMHDYILLEAIGG